MCDLAGSKGPKVKDGKSLPPNLYIGHFMKPYFKDKVTGVVSSRGSTVTSGGGAGRMGRGSPLCTRHGCRQFPRGLQGDDFSEIFWCLVVKVKVSGPGTLASAPRISPQGGFLKGWPLRRGSLPGL